MRSPFSKDVSLRRGKLLPSRYARTPKTRQARFGEPRREPPPSGGRLLQFLLQCIKRTTSVFQKIKNHLFWRQTTFCLPPEGGGVFVRKCRKELPFSNELCYPAHIKSQNHIKPPPTAGKILPRGRCFGKREGKVSLRWKSVGIPS